jgi:uncharacterized membrane protein YdbT with pleckstrin-like domain
MSDTAETPPQAAPPQQDLGSQYASLLASGERVLLVRRRHWLTFLAAGRWFVYALLAAIVAGALDASIPNGGISGPLSTVLGWAATAFLLVGVLGIGWYVVVWRVERYIVTTRRVIETGGVFNKWSRDTSLDMITDMMVDHPLLGRIFGYGDIELLTAAEQGTNRIQYLPDADGFKKELLDAKHEHELEVSTGRAVQPGPDPVPAPAEPAHASAEEVDASLTRLAGMRDRGLITQDEFDAKKKELLDRI